MKIQNDKTLKIAVASGRKAKKWQNRDMTWSDFLSRLSRPVITGETVAEYAAMPRDRQSEVKDVGGYVAGYLNGGSRSDVRLRSMVTLDADFADGTLWDAFCFLYGCAAAIYSTHKHRPDAMRLRLVIPLARDVTPDEYGAVSRRIASDLGMDFFDDTTYQPERLMYWPSCSSDGAYLFQYNDGGFLNPDEVLSTYLDWHDMSAWPTSSRIAELVRKSGVRQGDPLEKPGIVGAFCRTYSISEAIEKFIPDYTPAGDGRYTYAKGSTAAGVVVYEDKWIYSHHATDPCSMKLCNAFDMVRLHRFGEDDADTQPDTPPTKLPSYRAMHDFALADGDVRARLIEDRTEKAKGDFEDLDAAAEDWKKKLDLTEKGGVRSSIGNAVLVLENDPALKGCLAYDRFNYWVAVGRPLPWRGITDRRDRAWQNSDESSLRFYLEKNYGITGKDKIADAVAVVADKNAFHPICDYLDTLTWDGTARLDTLLIDYQGAKNTPYTRAVTRKTFVGAVARVRDPGCKMDYMLVLKGPQGIGKSSLAKRLGGDWFSDTVSTLEGKGAYEQLRQAWIIELSELSAMKKADIDTIKQFITKQTDQYRPAYGRVTEIFPRQCIFIGTVNDTRFLRDPTGNRRFWVVACGVTDRPCVNCLTALDDKTVEQIWAEADARYRAGEPLYLDPTLEAQAQEIRENYTETDDRQGLIAAYLERLLPENWREIDLYDRRAWLDTDAVGTVKRTRVCRLEIWCEVFGFDKSSLRAQDGKEIESMLNRLGWYQTGRTQKFGNAYGLQREYMAV